MTEMTAVDYFLARKKKEEGERIEGYDDATGKTVKAPIGNLTWGRGYNLSKCASPGLFDVMDRYLADQDDLFLQQFAWYLGLDPIRQSALLDIAENAGREGLLHFPLMLHYLAAKDWSNAASQ